MPPSILSSPLLSIPVLNTLLRNTNLTPEERIPLLHAKITLLTNGPSSSLPLATASSTSQAPAPDNYAKTLLEEVETRIEIAKLVLGSKPVKWVEAENELTMAESRCKPFFKKSRRMPAAEMGQEMRNEDSLESMKGDEEFMGRLKRVRVAALRELTKVEDGLGREGRAKRWRELVIDLTKT